jgi:hypothetical protein
MTRHKAIRHPALERDRGAAATKVAAALYQRRCQRAAGPFSNS